MFLRASVLPTRNSMNRLRPRQHREAAIARGYCATDMPLLWFATSGAPQVLWTDGLTATWGVPGRRCGTRRGQRGPPHIRKRRCRIRETWTVCLTMGHCAVLAHSWSR